MSRNKDILFVIVFCCLSFFSQSVFGQFSVETSGVISSDSTTPFWFQSNRNGLYSGEGAQFLTRFQYHDIYEGFEKINVIYGASLLARPGKSSTFSLNQGYVKLQASGFEIAAGRFVDPSPNYKETLGMGSLGISTNASPIPKFKFGLNGWQSIPFTNQFIDVKGYIAHGWLGSNRYTDDVLLHEKAGYLRIGGDLPVNIYGGLVHYAQWGGKNHPEDGDIPQRFSDFINVFLVRGGDEETPGPEVAYALGNHLGSWSFGSLINLKETNINVYLQSPIETKYDLKLKNIHDVLTGISIDFSENLNIPIDRFVYEYLYTKNQGGPRREDPDGNPEIDLFRGNQNYFNHWLYRTGWVYNRRTIGNPLFTVNDENLGILNNRIIAHHIGFETGFDQFDLFGKVTFSRNFGKRCDNRIPDLGEQELFKIQCENTVENVSGRSLDQWSFVSGVEFPVTIIPEQNFSIRIEAAIDNGRLFGDQFGLLTGIRWTL